MTLLVLFGASHAAAQEIDISYQVDDGGKEWIRVRSEMSGVFPLPPSVFQEVLLDFSSYPSIFPRLRETRVLDRGVETIVIQQHYEVAALGLRFPSTYSLFLTPRLDQNTQIWSLSWSLADSDGSIGGSVGAWTLEPVQGPSGAEWTRVTQRNEGSVRRNFPVQESIMRTFGAAELTKNLRCLYEVSAIRSGGTQTALLKSSPSPQ